MRRDIIYFGKIIGYTYNEGSVIEFLDDKYSKEEKNYLDNRESIGISSKKIEVIDENGCVNLEEITEVGVIKEIDDTIKGVDIVE